jgi:uncharacterized damage-inducible protein DinB
MPHASPLRPAEARAIFAYNRALFDRYVRRLSRLPWREVSRDRGIGHGSLLRTLVHILNVHEAWFVFVVPGLPEKEIEARFRDPSRHPESWKELRPYARRVWAGVERTVGSLTDRSIGRGVRAPWMPGEYTVGDVVLQTTLEEAHHLGEIIGALWQRNVEPPMMTWIDLKRAAARPRRRR